MTYLNHAGTSWPKPAPVQRAVADALRSSPSGWSDAFTNAHAHVARAFGVTTPERLLLTPGCTSALALAVADLPWRPGERILTSALEHHALQRPALQQARQNGIGVTAVPRGEGRAGRPGAPLDLAALERELRAGGVRLVAVTAACNVTGELLPIAEVAALAHEHGALCLVDGAQVCGWMPIDVVAQELDLFAFAGHKALQAPWGIGGLYVAPHVSMATPAATCELPPQGHAPSCNAMPGYCDGGSVDRAALAGLVAGIDWLSASEQTNRLHVARVLIEQLAQTIEALPGATLLGLRDPEARLPTIAFTLAGRPSAALARAFAEQDIYVGSGLQCAPLAHESLGTAPEGATRLSAGPTTTPDDIARVRSRTRFIGL